jgi:hypothetical protein
MTHLRRSRRRAAAFAILILVPAGSALLAQETNTVVGPPQVKDFQLPGQRTTPPAPAPAPTTTAPAPTPAPTVTTLAPTPAARTGRPTASAPARRPAPAPAARSETPAPVVTAPVSAPVQTAPTPVEAAPAATPAPAPAPLAIPPAAENPRSLLWLWVVLGAIVAALAAFAFFGRRRRSEEELELSHRDALAGALVTDRPAPQPDPEPAAPAEPPRAWLELDIVPERASATDRETIVNYELVLRNTGGAEAGNIRIDPRMFNANEERAIADFFAGPIHAHSGSPHVTIQPGAELRLETITGMPKEEVKAIEVQGRSIFVPMIAINVAYDWEGGGAGRSSKSWLVGREAETPSARMGPFRLDLGPRIYRQVGRREAKLVMV